MPQGTEEISGVHFNADKNGRLVRNPNGMRNGNPTVVHVELDDDLLDVFNRATGSDPHNQLVALQLQTNRLLRTLAKEKP
jgi:hypothetical protein